MHGPIRVLVTTCGDEAPVAAGCLAQTRETAGAGFHRADLRRDPPPDQGHRPAPRRDLLPDPGVGRAGPGLPRLARPDHDSDGLRLLQDLRRSLPGPPAPAPHRGLEARTAAPGRMSASLPDIAMYEEES